MPENAPHLFGNWESFYVIVGSSAAALTGLQFVVITLVTDIWRRPSTPEIGAFATPTIIHFSTALLVSATLSAPWPAVLGPRLLIGLSGIAGIVYVLLVIRRAFRSRYRMVLEDWVWHVSLPFVGYVALAIAALMLEGSFTVALFAIAGATFLFLAIGIHNAWDTATYVASGRAAAESDERGAHAAAATTPPAVAS